MANVDDVATLSDAGQVVDHTAYGIETLTLSDAPISQWLFADGLEYVTLTDSVVVEVSQGAVLADTQSLTDDVSITLYKDIIDTVSTIDVIGANASWDISILDDAGLQDVGEYRSITDELVDDLYITDVDLALLQEGIRLYGRWFHDEVVPVELLGVWEGGVIIPVTYSLYEE